MNTIEMNGFLTGKCLPGDMRINETNAEYLVRKFAEKDEQIRALTEQRDAVVAENVALKKSEADFNKYCREECESAGDEWVDDFTETPATDAAIAALRAEARADAFSHAANSVRNEIACLKERSPTLKEMACLANEFDSMARQLRESKGEVSNG